MSFKFETPQPVTPGPRLHPGPIIQNAILKPLGLTVTRAAELMGVDRSGLNHVMNGRYALTSDLAYRLEALTGVAAKLLIDMQAGHDWDKDADKRADYKARIERIQPPAEDAPAARRKAAR